VGLRESVRGEEEQQGPGAHVWHLRVTLVIMRRVGVGSVN
jgi:hypothetical protein